MPDAFGNALGYSIAEGSGQTAGSVAASAQRQILAGTETYVMDGTGDHIRFGDPITSTENGQAMFDAMQETAGSASDRSAPFAKVVQAGGTWGMMPHTESSAESFGVRIEVSGGGLNDTPTELPPVFVIESPMTSEEKADYDAEVAQRSAGKDGLDRPFLDYSSMFGFSRGVGQSAPAPTAGRTIPYVSPQLFAQRFDMATRGVFQPGNTPEQRGVFLAGAAGTFIPMLLEEGGRTLVNVPGQLAAFTRNTVGVLTAPTTEQQVLSGLSALTNLGQVAGAGLILTPMGRMAPMSAHEMAVSGFPGTSATAKSGATYNVTNSTRAELISEANARSAYLTNKYGSLTSEQRLGRIDELSRLNYERRIGEAIDSQQYIFRYLSESSLDQSLRNGSIRGYATTEFSHSSSVVSNGAQILPGWGVPQYGAAIPVNQLNGFSIARPMGNAASTGWEAYTNSYPKAGSGGWNQFLINEVPIDQTHIFKLKP